MLLPIISVETLDYGNLMRVTVFSETTMTVTVTRDIGQRSEHALLAKALRAMAEELDDQDNSNEA